MPDDPFISWAEAERLFPECSAAWDACPARKPEMFQLRREYDSEGFHGPLMANAQGCGDREPKTIGTHLIDCFCMTYRDGRWRRWRM